MALGFIEAIGLTASVEAVDAMIKAADVEFIGTEKIGSGLVSVVVKGEVSAVEIAVEVGCKVVENIGELVAYNVMSKPEDVIESIFKNGSL
ncbi:MAG: BMC domain-containing protein [Lachnospirales bacterium]